MNCGIEFGKCDICGKDNYLGRTYFEYDIKCDCHSPRHFELVVHCKDCIPSIPKEIHPHIKAMDGKSYKTTITNILPIEIVGEFIIIDPIIHKLPMIHEEICTYEVCKLAKEKGFDVPTFGYYRIDTEDWYRTDVYDDWNDSTIRYSAPTQSLLQRWLREEKKYAIAVFWDMLSKDYRYEIVKTIGMLEIQIGEKDNYSNSKGFATYELALEDALKYALENLV